MTTNSSFPLRGVIGIVANSVAEIEQAGAHQLQCIELRADLLLDADHTLAQVLAMIGQASAQNLTTLFTLRHPTHGGKFEGSETERADISRAALAAGAAMIDLEWKSEAANKLLSDSVPMILSHHDFTAMPSESELSEITAGMSQKSPRAIKLVPTANGTPDALRMLRWVSDATDNITRIGFAMGATGACSRILTTACGGPVTYTSFGPAVAPGQVNLDELLQLYDVMRMNNHTRVVAVAANTNTEPQVLQLNNRFRANAENRVAVGFPADAVELLGEHRELLRIDEIITTE